MCFYRLISYGRLLIAHSKFHIMLLLLSQRYRLTWVVPEKGPLNGCVCVCIYIYIYTRVQVRTGPYADNPMCPPPPEPCRCTVMSCRASGGTERRPLDGVTKALLIDYRARQLIHCTNLFQVGHPALLRPLSPTYLRNYTSVFGELLCMHACQLRLGAKAAVCDCVAG